MQHDDVIWRSIHKHFCSYKVSTARAKFCRNKYNLTGLCERLSCPLANSRYATIVENDDRLYLFVKTAERAHSPRRLWERIRLSRNYRQALKQIDEHLQYWPQFYVHKAKQRLTKMTQYIIRKNRLALQSKTRFVGIKKKVERREVSREAKAVRAAKLEQSIEKELLERLKSNAYGDIYNFNQEAYENALDAHVEDEEQQLRDEETNSADGIDEMELEDEDEDEYEARLEDSDDDDEDDIEFGDIEQTGVAQPETQFDFDDDDDDDNVIGEVNIVDDDDDDDDAQDDDTVEDGDAPVDTGELKRPRNASELDAYVREKARRRKEKGNGNRIITGSKGPRKKGRKLGKARERGDVRIEVEYEREREAQSARQDHSR